ncbi:MAG: hypothetical protein V3U72_01785 [Candidatus Aenigmarchaeota archaeon]
MKKIKFELVICVFLLSLGLSACSADAVSIGISPAEMYFNNILKGGYAEGSVAVSTSSETPVNFMITAKGSIKDWIEFEPSENLTMSRNEMRRVRVIVKPPENVANGVYTGNILVTTEPTQPGEGDVGIGVTAGTSSDVSVRITGDEIKKASVESISVKDTEEGHPVEFSILILNEGNVIIYPLMEIRIMEKGESEVLKSGTHIQTEILPTKMKIIKINVDTEGLEIGEYKGNVKVFLDEEKLAEETLVFNLFERGTLSKRGFLQKIWNEPWVNVGDIVKIDAYFENSGELLVTGKFRGEIYTGDRLVDVVESEELEVPVGKTVVMSAYFRPALPGQYVVRGQVIFGGKTTETKESFINVNPGQVVTGPRETDYVAIAFAIIAIFIIIILLKGRLRRGIR